MVKSHPETYRAPSWSWDVTPTHTGRVKGQSSTPWGTSPSAQPLTALPLSSFSKNTLRESRPKG